MRNIVRCSSCLLLSLFVWALVGCGKKDEATTTPAPTATGGVQDRLNDPSVSAMEKEQIRKHMGGTGAAGAASSPVGSTTTAPGAGTPAPGGAGGQ